MASLKRTTLYTEEYYFSLVRFHLLPILNPFRVNDSVVRYTCEKCQRRCIVAYAMAPYSSHCEKALSRNKFIKRYKGSNFIAREFKKLFLCLTFCFYAGCGAETLYTLDKVETDIDYFIKKSLKIKYSYFILRDLHKIVIKQ